MSSDPVPIAQPLAGLVAHLNSVRPAGTKPLPQTNDQTEEDSA